MAEFWGLSGIEYMSDRYRIRECDPISADASRRNFVEESLKFVRQGDFLHCLSYFSFTINELGRIRIRRFPISPSSQHYCNTASRSHFRWRLSFPVVACPEPAPSQSEHPPDSRQIPTDFGPVVHLRAAEPRLAASSMVRPRIGSPTVLSADRAGAFDLRLRASASHLARVGTRHSGVRSGKRTRQISESAWTATGKSEPKSGS